MKIKKLFFLPFMIFTFAVSLFNSCDDDFYPQEQYIYEEPVDPDSPWPGFRHDRRNSGRTPIVAQYQGDMPWLYKTEKGIFSTPIIDSDGIVYVGSADYTFYAFYADGTIKWQYKTGEMIDSAGTISAYDSDLETKKIIFLSGDGKMYCRRSDNGQEIWEFEVHDSENTDAYIDWWEGNVVFGTDGNLYAGNTNWHYYSVNPEDGTLNWKYHTGNNAWSATAFDDDGNIYWGSCDANIHSVSPPTGNSTTPLVRWKKFTFGFVTASAAIGRDGTVYIGSFDSYMYALNPDNGVEIWKTPTCDHIYASAALGSDRNGNTDRVYFGSADGRFYCLDALTGDIIWTYETGDTIRSSAALGRASFNNLIEIVYFGCGNGKLYALNANNGTRRWSFNTTPFDNTELTDRNDLNASVSLSNTGVHVAGEHGYVVYVPYDYCLHVSDERCETDPGDEFEDDLNELFYVSSGGNIYTTDPENVSGSAIITQQFIAKDNGETLNAYLWNTSMTSSLSSSLSASVSPAPSFSNELYTSADGTYCFLVPDGIFTPGTQYSINYNGSYFAGGKITGNRVTGGYELGTFTDTLFFTVPASSESRIPLYVSEEEVTGLLWARLSAPIPPMLASLNQIGFDSFNWMLGTIYVENPDSGSEGRFIMWATAAKYDENGIIVADPDNEDNRLRTPFNGQYKNDYFILKCENYTMSILNFDLLFSTFQLRGQLGTDLLVKPGATIFAKAPVSEIPDYSFLLVMAGLANNTSDDIIAIGSYITRPYSANGPANKKPDGISINSFDYTAPAETTDGSAVATFTIDSGYNYLLSEHIPTILLIDMDNIEAVNIDYMVNVQADDDLNGNLNQIILTIPAGTIIPANTEAYVILDIFPFYHQSL